MQIHYNIYYFFSGSFIAVGTMEPHIDIWDVDIIDTLEPAATLGMRKRKSKKVKCYILYECKPH